MSKHLFFSMILLLLVTGLGCGGAGIISQPDLTDDLLHAIDARTNDPIGVAVSPQTFILDTVQSGTVKVHTSISISLVNTSSLKLNGIPATSVGVDLLGHVVGIFNETAVEATTTPPSSVMIFTGLYKSGIPFSGSDTVKVIN